VKPVPLEYRRVESVEEAVSALAEGGPEAKVLAGGQSFVPMLNMRIARPTLLVDVNRVPGLDGIATENGHLRVGAMCRQRALERSALARERCPLLASCLPFVGHVATRNRGTVGGSIAHADAAAELPLALVALGGSAVAESPGGRRTIPADDLFVSYFTTALEPDELLVETVWPAARPGEGFAFEELALRHGDYALSMAACVLRVEGGVVAEVRLVVGAVGHADGDAVVVGGDARQPVAGADRVGAEALAHGVGDDPLEHPAVDRELRDVVPRVQAAGLVPDLLALAVEVEELGGPQGDGVERVEQPEVAQRADGVGQRVDPDAELADLARRLEHGDIADPALVQRERRREAADATADDEDAHVPKVTPPRHALHCNLLMRRLWSGAPIQASFGVAHV